MNLALNTMQLTGTTMFVSCSYNRVKANSSQIIRFLAE